MAVRLIFTHAVSMLHNVGNFGKQLRFSRIW